MAIQQTINPANFNMLKYFEWLDRKAIPLWLWIVLIWAAFIFPAIAIRSFHYEEGYVVGVARSAIEDGNWLVPHLYGWRFVERPHLMAWSVAALGAIFGGVDQWIARVPTVLSLLASCLLIFSLVRRHASALAGLFAAACFIVSPMMLQKIITAEPDIMVSSILFGTFIVWWNGAEHGPIGWLRWLAIGGLLALAVLVKGPQPIAYFGLGAGAFHLWRRQWLDLIRLAAAGIMAGLVTLAWYWAVYQPGDLDFWLYASKFGLNIPVYVRLLDSGHLLVTLLLEAMPALIVVAPFIPILWRTPTAKGHDLAIALLLYAVLASVALVVWPGARDRYAMPGLLAFAAAAGLAFEHFRIVRPKLVNAALMVGAVLIVFQITLSWLVMPAAPYLFSSSRIAATTVMSVMSSNRSTLYMDIESINKNVLGYIPQPVRLVRFDELLRVQPPAWMLVSSESARKLTGLRPDAKLRAIVTNNGTLSLLEVGAQ
jgi:4-amino-4-deoxy-L-arabinose transferase-like glycosyltransferase